MRHVCSFCGGQSKYCFESCRKDLGFDSKLKRGWDFPGGPVVKNLPSNAVDTGLIPRWGTKISHAVGQLSPYATITSVLQ